MSFSAVPKAAPDSSTPAGTSARDRAIAKLTAAPAPQAEQMPVPDANNVSPEDLSAITPKTTDEGQENTIEASGEETPAEAPKAKEEPLSTQYALLARKEKALRAKFVQQEQTLKAKEAALEAREDAMRQKDAEYSSKYISKDRLSQDPWNVLAEQGVSYDQLTQAALNQQTQDPAIKAHLARLEAQIKAQDEKLAQASRSAEEQQANSYKQALNAIAADAKKLVYTDPAFETIKETNSVSDVVDLIEKTFKEDGVLLSVEEAAQAVEDELVEEAMKISRIKKIQSRMQAGQKPAQQKQADPKQPQSKTLTNGMGSQRKLSSKERAILAFQGKLTK